MYGTVAGRRRVVLAVLVLAVPLSWLLAPAGFAAFFSMGIVLGLPALFYGDLTQMDITAPDTSSATPRTGVDDHVARTPQSGHDFSALRSLVASTAEFRSLRLR